MPNEHERERVEAVLDELRCAGSDHALYGNDSGFRHVAERLARAEAENEGRRVALEQVGEERRQEWTRAENAEAELALLRANEPEFMLDCLAGKLTTFDAISGYVSQLESENHRLRASRGIGEELERAVTRFLIEAVDDEVLTGGRGEQAQRLIDHLRSRPPEVEKGETMPRGTLPCGCDDTPRTMATMIRDGHKGFGHYAQDGDYMGACESDPTKNEAQPLPAPLGERERIKRLEIAVAELEMFHPATRQHMPTAGAICSEVVERGDMQAVRDTMKSAREAARSGEQGGE